MPEKEIQGNSKIRFDIWGMLGSSKYGFPRDLIWMAQKIAAQEKRGRREEETSTGFQRDAREESPVDER